jgi:hypothetical protein
MKKYIILLLIIPLLNSCNEPLEYKYLDEVRVVQCEGIDNDLMHEAYYSFRDDIYEYYKKIETNPEFTTVFYSLAQYIYKGAMGELDYLVFASPHTLKIVEELRSDEDLWNLESKKSNLNYNNPFINCLIENIKNEDIKQKIEVLRETNSLSPMILADIYRINIKDTQTDKHFEMFLAFDAYYQYLMEVDLSNLSYYEKKGN